MSEPILPPADWPQVDHPWAGSEDGHDCRTCIEQEAPDAPLANLHKCDRIAHVIADVKQAAQDHANRVAAENLRRYGGAAGPGLYHNPTESQP